MVLFQIVTSWSDVFYNSWWMTITVDCLEVFSSSVTQSPFGFANVEIVTVPTASFIYNFETFENCWALIFVGEKRLDAMCVLENNPKVITPYTLLCNPK